MPAPPARSRAAPFAALLLVCLAGAWWLSRRPAAQVRREFERQHADSVVIAAMRDLLRAQDRHRRAQPDRGFARAIEEILPAGDSAAAALRRALDGAGMRLHLAAAADTDGVVRRYQLRATPVDTTRRSIAHFADESTVIRGTDGEPSPDETSAPIPVPMQYAVLGFRGDGAGLVLRVGTRVRVVDAVSGATVSEGIDDTDGLELAGPYGPYTVTRVGVDVRILDLRSGLEVHWLEHRGYFPQVVAMDWRDDGRSLVTVDAEGTRKWHDLARGASVRTETGPAHPARFHFPVERDSVPIRRGDSTFSADARVAAVAGAGGRIDIVDRGSGARRVSIVDRAALRPVAFSRNARWLVARPASPPVFRVYDVTTGVATGEVDASGIVGAHPALPSPDGRLLAIQGHREVFAVRDARSGALLRTLPSAVRVYAVGPGGLLFALRSGTAEILDAGTGERRAALSAPEYARSRGGYGERGLSAAFSPDGQRLATNGGSARVSIWDVRAGRRVAEWELR